MAARECAARDARCLPGAARGRGLRRRSRAVRARGAAARRADGRSTCCPALRTATCRCRTSRRSLRRAFLAVAPGMRVLDACAAPGGKACHLLELEPGIAELVALDVDAARAARIEANLARLRLPARVVVGNAANPADWWDGRPFERILLDVPCSGTGRDPPPPGHQAPAPRRRHPALRGPAIRAAARRLGPARPGQAGSSYASCSIFAAENAGGRRRFPRRRSPRAVDVTESARLLLPGALPWQVAGPGCALASGAADADGFYYACLEKRA